MLGFLLEELVQMATERFGPPTVARAAALAGVTLDPRFGLAECPTPGTLRQLATHVSLEAAVPVSELLQGLGRRFFSSLLVRYPEAIGRYKSAADLFADLDSQIHGEVRRRYPGAILPRLATAVDLDRQQLTMLYRSPESLSEVAAGLIAGCACYFEERIAIRCEDLSEGMGLVVRFRLSTCGSPSATLFGGVLENQSGGRQSQV